MGAEAIIAISEMAKEGIVFYLSYMKQKGLTEAQIQETFEAARATMLKNDPNDLPN